MEIRGWIYIISNPAMPGLVKVGFSLKDPRLRAQELSSTGCPQPYRVEYDMVVTAPREVERKIHQRLLSKRDGKEWFRCSVVEAIAAVKDVSNGGLTQAGGGRVETDIKPDHQFSLPSLRSGLATMPAYVRGNRSARWWYSEKTGQLAEKSGSRRFGPDQCRYDGAGGFPGFAIHDPLVPWVPIDDVELID
jgi:hypothetical protein